VKDFSIGYCGVGREGIYIVHHREGCLPAVYAMHAVNMQINTEVRISRAMKRNQRIYKDEVESCRRDLEE
jgi:hypothetical protein